MKISKIGLDLLVHYETGGKPEKYLNAYWDANGKVWTIGIGSTLRLDGTKVQKGDKITLEQAYQLVDRHIEKEIVPGLNAVLPVLTQNQFDALVSFIYNVGFANFRNSTLLSFIKSKKPASEITHAFNMWNKSGGKVLQGLVLRRKAEANLFNTGTLVFY